MIHPFIHIGDIHLSPNHRQADRLAALDQVVDYGLDCDYLAAWLIPGDIFHAKSTIADRNAFAARLQRMVTKADVFIVPGNHDAPGDLDLFAHIHAGNNHVHVVNEMSVTFCVLRGSGIAAIACVPYPHRARFVAEGLSPEEVDERGSLVLHHECAALGLDLAKQRSLGAITLAIGHVSVAGAVSSAGQPQIGHEIQFTPEHFARLNAGYIGLNHIHRHQAIGGAVYAGSICRLDFGENEPKGFVLVNGDDATNEWTWMFVPLDVPQQITVLGHLTPDAFVYTSEFDDGPFDLALATGADVRVRYTYRKADASLIDKGRIEHLFADARSLKLEPQPVHEAEVRAPEVAAAKTLIEKVQAYCARMDVAWTDGLAEKVTTIQTWVGAVPFESRVA